MKILLGIPKFDCWLESINKLKENSTTHEYYIDELSNYKYVNKLIKRHKLDLVIPLNYKDMNVLSGNPINCDYLAPQNFNIVKSLDDKRKFYKCFTKHKLDVYLPKIYDKIDKIVYPAIAKPCVGFAGNGIVILHNEKDILEEHLDNEKYIICEYIQGEEEYLANIIAFDGIIMACSIYVEKFYDQYYVKTGIMTEYTEVNNDEIYFEKFKKIFKLIEYTGAACINFKIINSELKIFEINPRFGGTLIQNNKLDALMDEFCMNFVIYKNMARLYNNTIGRFCKKIDYTHLENTKIDKSSDTI